MTQRLRRWQTWFVLTCVAILVAGAFVVPLPYFTESPGRVLTLGGCVHVDSERAVPVRGDFLLTTVRLRRARPVHLVRAAIDPVLGLRPADRVVRGDVRDDEHFAAQREVFARSVQLAAALGLRQAGYAADTDLFVGDGAVVLGVLEDSPAHGVLRGGDVIVAIDGIPVTTDGDVRSFVGDAEPLVLRFTRDGELHEARLTPYVLRRDGEARAVLGLQLETLNARVNLPVPVQVVSGGIGGASAGLMIALAVYDQSDPDIDLAGGRRIAGTGTLTTQGVVGRIGGIDLKALAAHQRGADVFLAPASQADEARARLPADSTMRVVPVTTFDDAVNRLAETAGTDARGREQTPADCPFAPAA